jgi:hypothetical protein
MAMLWITTADAGRACHAVTLVKYWPAILLATVAAIT